MKQKDRQNESSTPTRDNALLTIGKVAKLAEVSIDTIRYYQNLRKAPPFRAGI